MRRCDWIVFIAPDGQELLAISGRESSESEVIATIGLLAYEHGIPEDSITIEEVTR